MALKYIPHLERFADGTPMYGHYDGVTVQHSWTVPLLESKRITMSSNIVAVRSVWERGGEVEGGEPSVAKYRNKGLIKLHY